VTGRGEPLWAKLDPERVDGYWAVEAPQEGRTGKMYFPALGGSGSAWKGETWVKAAGYAATTAGRRQLLTDMEILADELSLVVSVPGYRDTRAAVQDLHSLAGNRGWRAVRIEPRLPTDFLDYLAKRLDEHEEPQDAARGRTWTPEKIRRALRKNDRTQVWLADRLGCTPSMVSQLVSGSKAISQSMDLDLTMALKTTRVNRQRGKIGAELTGKHPSFSAA
jgi:hypothetical protein